MTGDTLLVQAERTGELVAVAADPAEYRELGRIRVLQGSRTWNTFALAGGRLYLRNHEEMVCYELPGEYFPGRDRATSVRLALLNMPPQPSLTDENLR